MKKTNFLKTLLTYTLILSFIFSILYIYRNFAIYENSKFSSYTYGSLINDIEKDNIQNIRFIDIKTKEEFTDKGYAIITF